ncbi:MAG TPA: LysE family transporter [Candidatus Kapabacteria bacterium]|nr:LysE family transporter [Candidatus Kapabacteria bacterium]
MIVALFIGAVTGWLMSMPIGPVNAAAISRTLKYSFRSGFAVGLGAALMDFIYCGGSAQINQFLVSSPIIDLVFELIGLLALGWMGTRQLRSLRSERKESQNGKSEVPEGSVAEAAMKRIHLNQKSALIPFVIGILLYATNIMAVPEWIIVAGLWRSWGVLGVGFTTNAYFAIGAGIGTAGWYLTLVRWISKHHRGFKPATLQKINLGTGIAMLIFGAYFGYQIIFGTNWHEVKVHFKEDTSGFIIHL